MMLTNRFDSCLDLDGQFSAILFAGALTLPGGRRPPAVDLMMEQDDDDFVDEFDEDGLDDTVENASSVLRDTSQQAVLRSQNPLHRDPDLPTLPDCWLSRQWQSPYKVLLPGCCGSSSVLFALIEGAHSIEDI